MGLKKIRVNLIVVLVILALMALLVIQIFQTLQLYDRKARQFDVNLHTALERIAIQHEKAEDIRRYMQIVNEDFSIQYKDILKKEFKHILSSQESISIKDTIIYEQGSPKSYLIIKGKTIDQTTGVTAEQRIIAKDIRKIQDLMHGGNKRLSSSKSEIAIQLDQRVLEQIFKKAKFVNEMMLQAFRNNEFAKAQDRINLAFLDSIIAHELADDDLPQQYAFCILDSVDQIVPFRSKPKHYLTKVNDYLGAETLLFPGNILDDDLFIRIEFPNKKSFIVKEMWTSFTFTLILVVLIILTLIIMFRTILMQKKLSEAKTDFISNMTHEFKTPISTISLAVQAMKDPDVFGDKNDQSKPFLGMIEQENKRLEKLVEEILQSATIDRKEIKLQLEKVNLSEILIELCEKTKFRIEKENGHVHLELPENPIYIQADKLHLTHAVSNILDNAIKYCDTTPDITIFAKGFETHAYVEISDRGIGIKKEDISKIFDKLYRVPTGNVHNVKGFGLGLSYVKEIVKLHGWKITVRSKLNEGTTFKIEF